MEVLMSASQGVLCFQQQTESELRARRQQLYGDGKTVSQTWCDPDHYGQIIGADCGCGMVHFFNLNTEIGGKCRMQDFLQLAPQLGRGSLLVMEKAHLATPQTSKSLAQPYTAEQLLQLYHDCEQGGVTIKLFPHAHTRKARDWVAANMPETGVQKGKGTDENDAKGLAYYVKNNNGVSLLNPPLHFGMCEARAYGCSVVKRSNDVLNVMRRYGYEREEFVQWFDFAWDLTKYAEQRFDFVEQKVAFSIASLIVTEQEGELMAFAFRGKMPGVNFWMKKVLQFSPCHQQAGIARSNICWHRFRPYLITYADKRHNIKLKPGNKYKHFSDYTDAEDAVRRMCWHDIRRQVKAFYRAAVEKAKQFKRFEILRATSETV